MRKLFGCYYHGTWFVYSGRAHSIPIVVGEGSTLPAAYLDYMRKFDRAVKRNKAHKAEEQRCVDAIIAMQSKDKIQPPTNQEHVLVGDPPPIVLRPWWHRWFS